MKTAKGMGMDDDVSVSHPALPWVIFVWTCFPCQVGLARIRDAAMIRPAPPIVDSSAGGDVALRNAVTAVLLAGYGFVLSYLTLSPQTPRRLPPMSCLRLVPGRSIAGFFAAGGWTFVVNFLGNLAAFLPLGFLWPVLRRGRTNARRVVGLSAFVSLLIETLQLATGRRIADVDDVILNALGGLIGYAAYRGLGVVKDRWTSRAKVVNPGSRGPASAGTPGPGIRA